MPETDYLKIPQNRIGALIGNKGDVKKSIEKATETILDIDSEDGTVYITPQENMSDPLGVWNANHIVKAVARGFNPEVALKLVDDDIYLEVIKLPLYIGKSKNALSRYKGRIIGQNGKTREIIMDMAEVQMAIYGKTVSLIGEMDNIMILSISPINETVFPYMAICTSAISIIISRVFPFCPIILPLYLESAFLDFPIYNGNFMTSK